MSKKIEELKAEKAALKAKSKALKKQIDDKKKVKKIPDFINFKSKY